jgi:hypothetical protein
VSEPTSLDATVNRPWAEMVSDVLQRTSDPAGAAVNDLSQKIVAAIASEVAAVLPPGRAPADLAPRLAAVLPDVLPALAQALIAPAGGGLLGAATALTAVTLRLTKLRDILRVLTQIFEDEVSLRTALGAAAVSASPAASGGTGRWTLTDPEIAYYRRLLEPGTAGATRTTKLVDTFRMGPIPQTEDADALMLRAQQADIVSLQPVPCPQPGYALLREPLNPGAYMEIGKAVHAAAERALRAQRAKSTLVFDAMVFPPGATAGTHLARYSKADPNKGGRDLRLRILWETFKWYSGDTARGKYLFLRADMVDLDELQLWEVKPRRSLAMGAVQSWLYRARYNAAWAPYAAGQTDRSAGYLKWGGSFLAQPIMVAVGPNLVAAMATHPLMPGLVMYDLYRKNTDDEERKLRALREAVRRALDRDAQQRRGQQPAVVPMGQPLPAPPAQAPLPRPSGGKGQGSGAPAPGQRPPALPEKPPANDNEEGEGELQPAAARSGNAVLERLSLLLALIVGIIIFVLTRGGLRINPSPATGGGVFGPVGPYGPYGPFDGDRNATGPIAQRPASSFRNEIDSVMQDLASSGFPISA